MKTISTLALFATLAVSSVAFTSPLMADGFADGSQEMTPAPMTDAATDAANDGDIQRKTFLPYREEAVDRVQPMEVLPLAAEGQASAVETNDAAAAAHEAAAAGAAGFSNKSGKCAGRAANGWEAHQGLRLQEVLTAWAACEGWTVHWQTDRQYVLAASATIPGDFLTAAADLIGAFGQANPPAFGEFFQANKVLVVSTPTELDNQ